MDKTNASHFLPLVQALADGRTIQHRTHDRGKWQDMSVNVSFGGDPRYYRIKPNPPVEMVLWYRKSKDGVISYTMSIPGEDESAWMKSGYRKMIMREVVEE